MALDIVKKYPAKNPTTFPVRLKNVPSGELIECVTSNASGVVEAAVDGMMAIAVITLGAVEYAATNAYQGLLGQIAEVKTCVVKTIGGTMAMEIPTTYV